MSFTNPSLHGKLRFVEALMHALSTLGLKFEFYSTSDPQYKIKKEIPHFYYLQIYTMLNIGNIYSYVPFLLSYVVVAKFVLNGSPSGPPS